MASTRDRTRQINIELDPDTETRLETIVWNWQWEPGIRASKSQVVRQLIRAEFERRKLLMPEE